MNRPIFIVVSTAFAVMLLAVSIASSLPALGATERQYERYYQDKWCDSQGGETEVVLFDRTRVDCLTEEFAVEVKFGRGWAESIGQALYYSKITGKSPAVLLIITDGDHRFMNRFHNASDGLGIRLFSISE